MTFYNEPADYVPDVVIPSVTKYWEDNDNAPKKRPKKIKVNLLQNGVAIRTEYLNEENNWTFTLLEDKALPKYDVSERVCLYMGRGYVRLTKRTMN